MTNGESYTFCSHRLTTGRDMDMCRKIFEYLITKMTTGRESFMFNGNFPNMSHFYSEKNRWFRHFI